MRTDGDDGDGEDDDVCGMEAGASPRTRDDLDLPRSPERIEEVGQGPERLRSGGLEWSKNCLLHLQA